MPAKSRASALLLLAVFLLAAAAAAQEAPPAETLEGDQKIYIPFEDLKGVFEKEGQGVFVPYEEFRRLWEASLEKRPVPKDPPVEWIVTRASYSGRVDGDLAVVDAVVEFETFTPGWSAVTLGFGGVALGEARIGDEAATIQPVKGGYRVLVPEKGSYRLAVSFVAALTKNEDTTTVAFNVPPTPVSKLDFTVPGEGARVTVEPNLATTRTDAGSGETRVMAYVGAAGQVQLTWKPKPAEVKVGPALVFADSVVTAAVGDAAVRTRVDLSYRIHRAPLAGLKLAVPEGAKVLFVEGEELRSWDVAGGELTVDLHRPVEKTYRLAVTLESPLPEDGKVSIPAVRALGVAREQGFVLVRAPQAVKVLPESKGLYRTSFDSVPKPARAGDLILAWRYPAHPWSLDLSVTRVEPVVDVTGATEVRLDERRLAVTETLSVNVSRAGIFTLRLAVPAGLTVTDVSRDVVEDWRISEEGDRRILILDLKGIRLGAFAVKVTATRAVTLGEDATDLPLPLFAPLDVRRFEGIVGIKRDESLKVETKDVTGLVPAPATEFDQAAALAFRYRQAERAATLVVTRREPEVTALTSTMLRAEENRVAVTARIAFTVKYAGVDEFSFTLPAAFKEEIRVTGNNIREKPKEDLEEDGRFRQRVILQGKEKGVYLLTVEYDLPYPGLDVGEETSVDVPSLVVENVKREEGVYAIYREQMLEIEAKAEDLEPIDPRELPTGVDRKDVFLSYKYLAHPHSLTLKVTKHEFLDVLMAVVHHQHLVTVVNKEGVARTEVVLRLTNNGLQFLSIRLPKGEGRVDLQELEVWSRRQPGAQFQPRKEIPQAGAEGAILVRMPPEAGPDTFFYVRLVYSRRAELPGLMFHGLSYAAPTIQDGKVPVLGTTWNVYPPRDVKITHQGGTLTPKDTTDSWWGAVLRRYTEIFSGGNLNAPGRYPPEGVAHGISTLAPRNQYPVAFSGRSADPVVEVTFADPATFAFLKVVLLLIVLGIGVLGLKSASASARVTYVTACAAFSLALIPLASLGMTEALTAVLLGGLLAGLWWCAKAVVPGIREAFRRKPKVTPPPAPAPDAGEGEEE